MSLVVYHPSSPRTLFADKRATHFTGYACTVQKVVRMSGDTSCLVGAVGNLEVVAALNAMRRTPTPDRLVRLLRRVEASFDDSEGISPESELLALHPQWLVHVTSSGYTNVDPLAYYAVGDASPAALALFAFGAQPGAAFFRAVSATFPSVSAAFDRYHSQPPTDTTGCDV